MSLLAHLRLPPADFSEPELYVRTNGHRDDGGLRLEPGQSATFDTAFGVFALGRWRRITNIDDVSVTISVEGSAVGELVAVTGDDESIVAVASSDDGVIELSFDGIQASRVGSLYVRVAASSGGAIIRGGTWSTTTPATRQVRLGVAITTFNRQQYVLATIDKLLELERSVDILRGHLQIVVVDNARNLEVTAPHDAPIRVIPNLNLGGAGGFARGLMELRDGGWATHVVLMDDDISMEQDAIVRTVALLSHAKSDDLCVHGAMLSEEQRWMQFEAGATYSFRSVYPLQALGRLDDMRDRARAIADAPEVTFDYTAWWFTVFPIHLAQQNPLPVFVRGDDVAFGLMHTGKNTVTLNGIIVWHADFALKNNPSSLYYEVRNFALIDTLVFDNHKWWNLAWRYLGFGFRNLYSHRYASTEYMLRGMEQFLAGPSEWARIDHAALHDELRQVNEEKAGPLTVEQTSLPFTPLRPKVIRLIGFLLAAPLLGGSLIPKFLRAKRPGVALIDVRAVGLALRHDEIVYRHPRFEEGYVCVRDRERFKALQKRVFKTSWQLFRNYKQLKKDYRAAYPQMVSDAAWRARFEGTIC